MERIPLFNFRQLVSYELGKLLKGLISKQPILQNNNGIIYEMGQQRALKTN